MSIQNVNYILIQVVLDAHSKEIKGMYWNDDKKMLLTVSLDKSIKLHQFPIFWPSEMLRKSSHKNKVHLIEPSEKTNETVEIITTNDDELKENISSSREIFITDEWRELTLKEINCEDLNGWDYEI
jgi:hypothetical protein